MKNLEKTEKQMKIEDFFSKKYHTDTHIKEVKTKSIVKASGNKKQQKCFDSDSNRRSWSVHEDQLLKKYVKKYGEKWSTIGRLFESKRGKQCRERWKNHLDPLVSQREWTII